MASETPSLDELVSTVKSGAVSVQKHFDSPEDDWMPIVFIAAGKQLEVIGLDISDDDAKDKSVAVAATRIVQHGADKAAVISSAWSSAPSAEQIDEHKKRGTWPRPKDDALKRELLIICACERGGKPTITWAEIKRDGIDPPMLGEWEDIGEQTVGRFADLVDMVNLEF